MVRQHHIGNVTRYGHNDINIEGDNVQDNSPVRSNHHPSGSQNHPNQHSGNNQNSASFSDPSINPLYLHNADHAGINLVTCKLTGLKNFNTWKRAMVMALNARNKLVFVDGTYQEIDSSHPDYASWFRCNSVVCTWIVNSVDEQIAQSIMYHDSAKEMWDDINDQFKQSDGPRNAEIKQLIFSEVQGNRTVSAYYTKLKQLWEELKNHQLAYKCCCANPKCENLKLLNEEREQDKILKFLMGLNDEFKSTRGQILMMEPKPSMAKVFNLISQEERQRGMSNGSSATNVAVFQASQQIGSDDSLIAAYGVNRGKRPICAHCGLLGHTINKCYKLHGYPPGYKHQGQNKNTTSQNSNHNSSQRKENVASVTVLNNSAQSTVAKDTEPVCNSNNQVQKIVKVPTVSSNNSVLAGNSSGFGLIMNAKAENQYYPMASGVYSGIDDW